MEEGVRKSSRAAGPCPSINPAIPRSLASPAASRPNFPPQTYHFEIATHAMNFLTRLPLAAALVFTAWTLPAQAQDDRVSTGIVEGVSLENGTMTVRSDQTQRPMTFFGIA